ncbi:MAG: 4Fe-4S binding protein, partial [Thermoplasmata archaeon]|nr:4Fe-4S binding protein [Thermoplasmata archaeon]
QLSPHRKEKTETYPVPNKRCTGCGDCERICPRNAVKIINELSNIDYSLCIECYCCHEVCPENAINLKVLK